MKTLDPQAVLVQANASESYHSSQGTQEEHQLKAQISQKCLK